MRVMEPIQILNINKSQITKEAIRLISCLLEEETELPVTRLESWKENTLKYDTSNWENPVGK